MGKRKKREAVAQTQAEIVWATAHPLNAATRKEYDYSPFLKFLEEGARIGGPPGLLGEWQKPDYKYRDKDISLAAAWFDIPWEDFWGELFMDLHRPVAQRYGAMICNTCRSGEFYDPDEWPCNDAQRFLEKTGALE